MGLQESFFPRGVEQKTFPERGVCLENVSLIWFVVVIRVLVVPILKGNVYAFCEKSDCLRELWSHSPLIGVGERAPPLSVPSLGRGGIIPYDGRVKSVSREEYCSLERRAWHLVRGRKCHTVVMLEGGRYWVDTMWRGERWYSLVVSPFPFLLRALTKALAKAFAFSGCHSRDERRQPRCEQGYLRRNSVRRIRVENSIAATVIMVPYRDELMLEKYPSGEVSDMEREDGNCPSEMSNVER